MHPTARLVLPLPFLFVLNPLGLLLGAETLDELVVTTVVPYHLSVSELNSAATLGGGGDLRHLLRFAPNTQIGNAPGPVFAMRGISQEGTPTLGSRSNSSLNVLVGNVPRSTNTLWAMGSPIWDTAGLGVVRGPVLFGSGPVAQGGELRLEPNAPQFFHEGYFLAEFGEFGSYRSGITENFVIIPDKLAARVNIASEGTDGAVTNITLNDDEFEAVRRDLLRGQLRWRPAANDLSVFDLLVETERNHGNPLGLTTTLPGGDFFDREVAMNTREDIPADRYAASLRGNVDLGDGRSVEGEIAWQKLDAFQIADFDAGPALDWFYRVFVEERRLTGGTRLQGMREDRTWTLGVYAESSEYSFDFSGVGFAPVPQGSPFISRTSEQVDMAALFGHAEFRIWRDLWLGGGIRLDHQQRDQTSAATIAAGPSTAGHVKVSSTEWLPEAGLEWRKDDFKTGIRISRSYRPAASAYAVTLGTLQPYGAERGWETNVYAENEWDSLHLAGRLFYAKLNGQQVSSVAAGGIPILDQFITNAGRSTRAGAEIDLRWKGPGSLTGGISGGWLHTRFDELEIDGVDRSGQKFPSAPEFGAAIHLAWSPPVGWFCESALTWSDTSYSQANSPAATALEKRLLLSLRSGYRWQHAELYVFGTNLLNEDFALVRQDYTAIGRGIDGRPNMPRLIGVGLSMDW